MEAHLLFLPRAAPARLHAAAAMRLLASARLALLLPRRSLSSAAAAAAAAASRFPRARTGIWSDATRVAPSSLGVPPSRRRAQPTTGFHGTRPVAAKDYYDVLGVSKNANQAEIKKAFYAATSKGTYNCNASTRCHICTKEKDPDGSMSYQQQQLHRNGYIVATVVTVLAIVVIVKVVTVGVRPENLSLSVVQGRVGATALWKEVTPSAPTVQRGDCAGAGAGACVYGDGVLGRPYGVYDRPPTRTTYYPVEQLELRYVLSVDNPSGRGNVRCDNITVSFIDMPNGSSDSDTGPTTIGTMILPYGFMVKRQSSHKFSRTVYVSDTTVLAHIASAYGGSTSFTGKMTVTMNTSDTRLGHPVDTRTVSFECSPVEFSMADASATATDVQCTSAEVPQDHSRQ